MCHFLASGYLKWSDESQMTMVNRLLKYLVWHQDEFCGKDKLFESCAPTQWCALRRRREIFLLNIFIALVLARGKGGTICLANLWAKKSVSLLKKSFLRNFQAKLVALKSATYGRKTESTSRSSGFRWEVQKKPSPYLFLVSLVACSSSRIFVIQSFWACRWRNKQCWCQRLQCGKGDRRSNTKKPENHHPWKGTIILLRPSLAHDTLGDFIRQFVNLIASKNRKQFLLQTHLLFFVPSLHRAAFKIMAQLREIM